MTIKKIIATTAFFLDEFHHGAVNHLIHAIGFTLLGYGLGTRNLLIIIASPFVMEAGHVYNYIRGRHRKHAIKIIPLQIAAWLVFVGAGYLLAKAF
ncbi:MAG: hypothetical protein AABX69_04830 [Nanoarchaeota archaeon]